VWCLDTFHVTKQTQRQGYGTTIFQWIVDKLQQQGAQRIFLTNPSPDGKKFYKKLGWTVYDGEQDDALGGSSDWKLVYRFQVSVCGNDGNCDDDD
jgi:GNAT superfamily N-acetyltransferase